MEDDAGHPVHKLVADGAGEAVGEAHRGDKAGVGNTGGGKVGVLAELLHPDGADGELPPLHLPVHLR